GGSRAVPGLDVEADAVSLAKHHAGGPDLHVEPHRFVFLQPRAAVVQVVGTVGAAEIAVEAAVRCAQPAFRHGTFCCCCPTSQTSWPSRSILRRVAKISRSSVVLETQRVSTTGPVTSRSSLNGAVSKDTPSRGKLPGSTVEVHEAEAMPALDIPVAE